MGDDIRQISGATELAALRRQAVGFLINTKGPDDPTWTPRAVLHRASCGALTRAEPVDKFFTASFYAARDWLDERRPGNWEACARCSPRPSASEGISNRRARSISYVVNDKSLYEVSSVLHLSGCHTLSRANPLLLREFSDLGEAVSWLSTGTGAGPVRWRGCGVCRPVRLGVSRPTDPTIGTGPVATPGPTVARESEGSARASEVPRVIQRPGVSASTAPVPPWLHGPLELLKEGELRLQDGSDSGRRMAIIQFDNSVETSIGTFASLHPRHRGGVRLPRDRSDSGQSRNFHDRIEFLEWYVKEHGLELAVSCDEIVWYHDLRSRLYHGGNGIVPELSNVRGARDAAVAVFTVLFGLNPDALP